VIANPRLTFLVLLAALLGASVRSNGATPPPKTPPPKEPITQDYKKYVPDFMQVIRESRNLRSYTKSPKVMRLSSERGFYTLNLIPESDRANALVEAAIQKEHEGQYRKAMEMYQQVIGRHPDSLFRVSKYGVFVPVVRYSQLRILGFPATHLNFYRTKYDSGAKEAYETAYRKNSLDGLADIRDKFLCTSYGLRSILTLGYSALDQGHYLQALDYFQMAREHFPGKEVQRPELGLAMAYCRKMLSLTRPPGSKGPTAAGASELTASQLKTLQDFIGRAKPERAPFHSQITSKPHASADDYTLFPPTTDPMGLKPTEWKIDLPASRNDVVVYTQPVVTGRSVIYRHKNIIYSRSILNGEIQWRNDIGGRVTWQNRHVRRYPHDALLVQDGLVFTPMHKVGPSLVALDEVTGQLRWAYGPAVAATQEESKMRFEAGLAGGPRTVFAGYVLDNITGETHTDTEYGVIAFESTTGRVRWRREICRLPPGKFSAGFAVRRRNRIRSFSSPPLYYQGTVYYGTNSGAIAALDALSGQVKWLMRYPYIPSVHDATRGYGSLPAWSGTVFTAGMHEPAFWFNQRPLVVGDRLFVLPVNSKMMHCLDRRTGKVLWSRVKTGYNYTHVLGPTSEGYLVLATSGRGGIVHLIDPKNGKTVWTAPSPIIPEKHPVMVHHHNLGGAVPGGFNNRNFFLVARPFLMSDDRLVTTYFIDCGFNVSPWCASLAEFSLKDRKLLNRRRHYLAAYQQLIAKSIHNAKGRLKSLEELPHKSSDIKHQIKVAREISKDTVPQNKYGPFLPFARVTVERYGTPFELRITPRSVGMLYDRGAVNRDLAKRTDSGGLFAKAELAVSDARLAEAAELMKRSLAVTSSEDLDFRAVVNQQLHVVYRRLAQSGVRRGDKAAALAGCIGMSRTVNTLEEEMQSLLALSEAYGRQGDWRRAARLVQSLINTYGQREYPVPSVFAGDPARLMRRAEAVLDRSKAFADDSVYGKALGRSAVLSRLMLPLYSSALTPLRPDLRVRAGELGAARLIQLQKTFPDLRRAMEKQAKEGLAKWGLEEQLLRLWEYPGTAAAQKVIDGRLADIDARLKRKDLSRDAKAEWRKRRWMLADAARIGRLELPKTHRAKLLAPEAEPTLAAIRAPMADRKISFDEERSPEWLVLQRAGQRDRARQLIFLGGRVKKRLDYKFLLYCVDTTTGKMLWKARESRGDRWMDEIRLGAKGDEPGFAKAYVYKDIVVVHGMSEALAFGLNDGKLRWRYVAPHTFEIRHALMSGDLLVLAGSSETVALYLGTDDPRGEVAWQEKGDGEPYCAPYFHGDRLVEVRKMPSNLTVRYRSTGKLIGRLALPDLLLHDKHPLLDRGPRALAIAHDREKLAVTDGWYYIMVNVEKMKILWKRLIDANDATRLPPIRFELNGDYLAVVKQDYDVKTIHMLSSATGNVLWRTDPKNPRSPYPIHSMFMRGGKLYGIKPYAGQGFYLAGIDCKTGKDLFPPFLTAGYRGKPESALRREFYGNALVVAIKDRQDFEMRAFNATNGKQLHTVKIKATGRFGVPGNVSATVQNGSLVLMGKRDVILGTGK
jgi:outer membrane protein assembly factor BamB/tetratricopeptide (TPR) repeat protein